MRLKTRLRRLGCLTIVTSAVAACSHMTSGVAVRQPFIGEDKCTSVSAPMTTIEPQRSGEPVIRIPHPENWERSTMLDSELIRYAMANAGMAANNFAPSALVTLEDVTTHDSSPGEIFDMEWDGLVKLAGGTDLTKTSDSPVCGFPAQRVTFALPQMGAIPPRKGTAIAVVTTGEHRYAAVIGLQTTQPDKPAYVDDAKTILDGFQVMVESR
ncbi:LpqN/LpqT family lipoprotein [Mycobacterium sp. MMS18-G62]